METEVPSQELSASGTNATRTRSSTAVPVAAIITTYNGRTRGFIDRAITSVLEQSAPPEEFVVIDDGSQDGTADWLRSRHPNLRVVSKANGGPASARNRGVLETHSPFLCFLDDDDTWLPDKLANQHRQITGGECPALVFSAAILINERDEPTGKWTPANVAYEWPQVLLLNPIISPCCAMIRRDAFVRAGGFDEAAGHRFVEDYDLWIKMAREHRMQSHPKPLTRYRRHGGQNSGNYVTMVARVLPILQAHAAGLPGFDPRRVIVHQIYSHFFFALGTLGWPAARDILRMNSTGRWFPGILMLRVIGGALRPFRSVQRTWRDFEYRRLFA